MVGKKKDKSGKPGIIRPFGNLECYEFHMHQLGFLGSTIVNCRYTIPPPLAASEHHGLVVAQLENAIARVVLEHPALRIDVVNADSKRPDWVAIDRIDFAHHVMWEEVVVSEEEAAISNYEKVTLRGKIEKHLNEPYVPDLEGRPWWRVLALFVKTGGDERSRGRFVDVVFDYSHAFSDGTGGKIFHETLLRMLNNASVSSATTTPNDDATDRGAEMTTDTSPDPQQQHPSLLVNRVLQIPSTASTLPPPIEKLSKFPVSTKFVLINAWKELLPSSLVPSSIAHAHWAPILPLPTPTPHQRRSVFRKFDIPAEPLRAIVAACRAHDTTVTGLLHALLLVSLASRFTLQDAVAFIGSTALDLRRHITDVNGDGSQLQFNPKRTMADYVSAMTHEFDEEVVRGIRAVVPSSPPSSSEATTITLSPALLDLIWKYAGRVRGDIKKRLDRGLRDDLVGLMKFVSDWRAQFRVEAKKPRPSSWVVTNLGVVEGKKKKQQQGITMTMNAEEAENYHWGIEHSVFAVSAEVCGAAFQISPISVADGALCVSCCWQDDVLETGLGEAFVADLERWLRFLGTP